jgi:uncharacterized cupredoxin-like copper-binding protein
MLFVLLTGAVIGLSACSSKSGESTTGGVRTIEIKALDSLRFDPAEVTVTAGEPIHFVVTNEGSNPHEFVLGDEALQMQHEEEMESDGSMQHGMDMDLPALTLAPGETKEATVTFDDAGTILYGCHESGHYDGGMVGTIRIT